MKSTKKTISATQRQQLVATLRARFEQHMSRHKGIAWAQVEARLQAHPGKLWSLLEMERTGGEPDVTGQDQRTGEYIFCDCAAESPAGRRSLCYDEDALRSRKAHKPKHSAAGMADEMGITLLSEQEYMRLQELGKFDLKTSSWISTPPGVRESGGALFCDNRYGRVFVYCNGAESYYAARGFRGSLRV
jgi:hypothetical protein